MRVSAVFAFSVIASLAQAWTIPANTEDGFYSVSTTKDGSTVHEKISGPLEVELAESKRELSNEVSTLEERFPASVYCGCGFTLDPGNCDAAVADLKNQLTCEYYLFFDKRVFQYYGQTLNMIPQLPVIQ